MKEFKIIFAGSMGAGKTTAIEAISDTSIVKTDVTNTDKESHNKLLTTVGIDYGQIILPPDIKIGLYGTPGQKRFELIWRIVTNGALGAIILIDASGDKAKEELVFYVNHFKESKIGNIVVGLTHSDIDSYLSQDECYDILSQHQIDFPIFEIDAREKEDILLIIESLIASIEADLS